MIYNTNVDLVNDNVYTKFGLNLLVFKILSKNQILTSIKGCNSVANLQKTTIYNTNIDLVNDNVYTKFGLNRSILFQDIEQKLNYDGMTERLTERKNDGQGKSSVAPTKQGYKYFLRHPANNIIFTFSKGHNSKMGDNSNKKNIKNKLFLNEESMYEIAELYFSEYKSHRGHKMHHIDIYTHTDGLAKSNMASKLLQSWGHYQW